METVLPPRLRRGDLIGIVAPASPLEDPSRLDLGVRYLEQLGYRTLTGDSVSHRAGYLAGTDDDRLNDFHAMFRNKNVKAVFCVRGGYGSPRLLSRIDYRLIARNPKILVGYSDITALHLAIWTKTGMVTFHGPMLGVDMAGEMDPFAEERFWRLVTSPERRRTIADGGIGAIALNHGLSSGRLLGGNLSLVVSILGTPFQPEFRRAILFLEEIGEEPYRVDRMLTQLRNAGILRKASGIGFGMFSDCGPKDPSKPSFTVDQVLREAASASHGPVLSGLPFGHDHRMITLPVGVRARLDAEAGSLELLGPAVE
ncbi:MAG: LD-carboxypeptidase [Bacteroidota bacterium]